MSVGLRFTSKGAAVLLVCGEGGTFTSPPRRGERQRHFSPKDYGAMLVWHFEQADSTRANLIGVKAWAPEIG
jgi:hypothetical protein